MTTEQDGPTQTVADDFVVRGMKMKRTKKRKHKTERAAGSVKLSMSDQIDQNAKHRKGDHVKITPAVYNWARKKFFSSGQGTMTKQDVAIGRQEIQIHTKKRGVVIKPFGDYISVRLNSTTGSGQKTQFFKVTERKTESTIDRSDLPSGPPSTWTPDQCADTIRKFQQYSPSALKKWLAAAHKHTRGGAGDRAHAQHIVIHDLLCIALGLDKKILAIPDDFVRKIKSKMESMTESEWKKTRGNTYMLAVDEDNVNRAYAMLNKDPKYGISTSKERRGKGPAKFPGYATFHVLNDDPGPNDDLWHVFIRLDNSDANEGQWHIVVEPATYSTNDKRVAKEVMKQIERTVDPAKAAPLWHKAGHKTEGKVGTFLKKSAAWVAKKFKGEVDPKEPTILVALDWSHKKFPYTKAGLAAAKRAAEKNGKGAHVWIVGPMHDDGTRGLVSLYPSTWEMGLRTAAQRGVIPESMKSEATHPSRLSPSEKKLRVIEKIYKRKAPQMLKNPAWAMDAHSVMRRHPKFSAETVADVLMNRYDNLPNESMKTEAAEHPFVTGVRKIVKGHQATKLKLGKDKKLIDAFSASMFLQVFDALNPTNQKKWLAVGEKHGIGPMFDIGWKLTNKSESRARVEHDVLTNTTGRMMTERRDSTLARNQTALDRVTRKRK